MSLFRTVVHKFEDTFDSARMRFKSRFNLFDPVIIYPYRGYSNGEIARIEGRILEKERMIHGDQDLKDSFWNNLRKAWKRYESDEIPGARLEGEFMGRRTTTISDQEGFFTLEFENLKKKPKNGWHKVKLKIIDMPFRVKYEKKATGQILVSNQKNRFGIISDVDDTIIRSRAMNLVKKVRIMLTKNARTRVAFEGVEDLYKGLSNDYSNPLFFVSGSSYNLYDMLIGFCEYKDIPKAPFFLRNLGLNPDKWLKKATREYKKMYISRIMAFYERMPFILIGDSGQKDPEIYLDIHRKYPGRIMAIYIRHVASKKRKKELEAIADKLDIPLLIMEKSHAALLHAKEAGWIKQ